MSIRDTQCRQPLCELSSTGVGNLPKRNQQAGSPFTNCSNCMPRLMLLYFMNLPSWRHCVLHT